MATAFADSLHQYLLFIACCFLPILNEFSYETLPRCSMSCRTCPQQASPSLPIHISSNALRSSSTLDCCGPKGDWVLEVGERLDTQLALGMALNCTTADWYRGYIQSSIYTGAREYLTTTILYLKGGFGEPTLQSYSTALR